jgi:hypothetical protein
MVQVLPVLPFLPMEVIPVMLCYGAPSTARQLRRRQLGVAASCDISSVEVIPGLVVKTLALRAEVPSSIPGPLLIPGKKGPTHESAGCMGQVQRTPIHDLALFLS